MTVCIALLQPQPAVKRRIATLLYRLCLPMFLCMGCLTEADRRNEIVSAPKSYTDETEYDLEEIRQSGELICVTFNGPETYYTQGETAWGLHYQLAADFARKQGVRLRMETQRDTAALLRELLEGHADIVAVELPPEWSTGKEVLACGPWTPDSTAKTGRRQWLVRSNSPELADALRQWYSPDLRSHYRQLEARLTAGTPLQRRHRPEPAMRNKRKGIISAYDRLFMRHSTGIGWDWRLLAAQCYQESAFDPNAISPAGAIGLMQIMPSTAATLNVDKKSLFTPEDNVRTAVQYLVRLNRTFSDITDSSERQRFVLAAYNGGAGHLRDAMALAESDGRNARRWNDVAPYVLRLSDPTCYRHPLVKNGYMRGSETVDYVDRIFRRWNEYRRYARQKQDSRRP